MSAPRTAGAFLILSLHAAILVWICARSVRLWTALLLLTLCAAGTRIGLAAMSAHQDPLDYAREAVSNPGSGSFVTVALALHAAEWRLEDYPQMTRFFPAHACNKPPGPVMYWLAMFRMFSDQTTALNVGVILVGVIGAAAAALVVVWSLQLGVPQKTALHVGSVLSILPGTLVFFPLFDAAYATLALLLLIVWTQALNRRSIRWSILFGLLLSATLFCSFHILPIGWLLACETVLLLTGTPSARYRAALPLVMTAIGTCLLGQLLLFVLAEYNVVEMFRTALENQNALMAKYGPEQRPYPLSIPWDLYDFALGAGYITIVLAVAALMRRSGSASDTSPNDTARRVTWCGVGLLLFIAATGLLPGETARVWNFLYPILALPAGLFISGLSGRERLILLACQVLIVTTMVHSMTYIAVG